MHLDSKQVTAETLSPPAPQRSRLTVEGLAVSFKTFTLQDISFVLYPGQVTAMLGHNGAGKTTTMRSIMGLIRRQRGTVRLGSWSAETDEAAFRARIGFVPEEGHFYAQMRIRELIDFTAQFYPDWSMERTALLARMLSLDLTKKLGELSKGMRMKVSLILALSRDPDVLLLDEPTSGLDPRSRSEVLRLIRAAASVEGRAVVLSTHNLREAEEVADRLIIIDHGRVLADESMAEAKGRLTSDGTWSLESYYLGLVK